MARFAALGHAPFSLGEMAAATMSVTSSIATAAEGRAPATDLARRIVGIASGLLARVPARLLVDGGPAEVDALAAMLRGDYATHLDVDGATGAALLRD